MLLILAICSFLFLFEVILLIFLLDVIFGKLDYASNAAAVRGVIGYLTSRRTGGNFMDLGSAWGGFAVKVAKVFPQMQVLGIDDSVIRVGWAKTRSAFLKNASFKRYDIFAADVSSVDAVYIYLPRELMPGLEKKLQKELKPGAVVIANRVSFPSWPPVQTIQQLSIYVKE